MPTATFKLSIHTPKGSAFEGEAESLTIQTDDGQIQIFSGHLALASTLTFSRTEVVTGQIRREFLLRQGLVSVKDGGSMVSVLALDAESVETAQVETLEEYLAFISEKMKNKESLSGFQVRYLEDQLESVKKMVEVVRVLKK